MKSNLIGTLCRNDGAIYMIRGFKEVKSKKWPTSVLLLVTQLSGGKASFIYITNVELLVCQHINKEGCWCCQPATHYLVGGNTFCERHIEGAGKDLPCKENV